MTTTVNEIAGPLADDLDALIRLHERELDAATLVLLRTHEFPDTLSLLPDGAAGEAALAAMRGALGETRDDARDLDDLAADYAAIYLTNACGASPYESVWLHDEYLACQQPMFELRALYAAAGLRVDDWRKRYDDHLVLQLQYLAHRLRAGVPLAELGGFLDEHLGYWLPDFAARVAARAATPFYAALAMLTAAWVERLRTLIEAVSGVERTPREVMTERIRAKFNAESASVAPLKFMPGAAGPSY